MDLINSAIAEREENTVLLYNDVNVLYTNYEVSGTEELALETYLRSTTRWTGNTRFSVIGKDRFVTYKKVHPQNTTNYYSLVSVDVYKRQAFHTFDDCNIATLNLDGSTHTR